MYRERRDRKMYIVTEAREKNWRYAKPELFGEPESSGVFCGGIMSESRLGTVGIVVDDPESTPQINTILHQYADIIVGRLGIPYRSRGVSIIALAVDGSMDAISGMTGRLGKLRGVSVKAAISRR